MSKKPVKSIDPALFKGNGISYRCKVIGIQDVEEARGDQMCQEAMMKLKEEVKASGQHKQRIFVNVTLEGLRIVDAVTTNLLHTHPVHQISFISRDVTDSRAFGYIYSSGDGAHKFFAIKTANAAENLVMALRDLFQTVYEMKKKEIEEAKAKAAETEGEQGEATAEQTTSSDQTAEGQESFYQVPKSNAPVNPESQNLLDLEDQVDTILKGIEQIKNLEFDELTTDEAPRQPPSSTAPSVSSPTSTPSNDPWGLSTPSPTATATAVNNAPLSNLQQLSSPAMAAPSSFPGMQAFPGAPAPAVGMAAPGFGMVAPPFGMPAQQMGMVPGAPYGGAAYVQQPGFASPFVAGGMRNPIPGQPGFVSQAGFNPFGMAAPGMAAPSPQQVAAQDPFQAAQDNLLQPMRPGGSQAGGQAGQAAPKSPTREALFGDLVDIKKTPGASPTSATKTPKEMFKELTQPPKKSLNELKTP